MPHSEAAPEPKDRQAARSASQQLPSSMLAEELGKVYVRQVGDQLEVEFTVWVQELSGALAEGWQTGLALDASASMKNAYGRNLKGQITKSAVAEYERRGWVITRVQDGQRAKVFSKKAYEDAIERGLVRFTDNVVEPLARDFLAYLASQLDSDGRTTAIYWACGDGGDYEVIGDFSEAECRALDIQGPQKVPFGKGTRLTPAVQYFEQRFTDSPKGMYVCITDGKLDDLERVKEYTTELAQRIEAGKRNPVKFVLIGVGAEVDEDQMIELDDLDTGTDVDIWDHKIAAEMRAISEILVELVGEIKTPPGTVYDDKGSAVAKFADGLPESARFVMSASSQYFELEVGGRRIRQSVVVSSR